jgi:predicted regulator of Ras-like GTPase activity (Roadblock/LC7/MglB family)
VKTPFTDMLTPLTRLRGVRGCLVASEDDGIIVEASMRIGLEADVVAATAAALYRKARRCSEAAGLAAPAFLQLEAENGHVCAAGREGLVLVVVLEPRAQIGLIRAMMLQAVEALV